MRYTGERYDEIFMKRSTHDRDGHIHDNEKYWKAISTSTLVVVLNKRLAKLNILKVIMNRNKK